MSAVCLPCASWISSREFRSKNAARTDDALTAAVGIVGVVGVVGAFRTVDVVFIADATPSSSSRPQPRLPLPFRPLPLRPPLPSCPRTRPPPSPPPSAPLPARRCPRPRRTGTTTPASNPTDAVDVRLIDCRLIGCCDAWRPSTSSACTLVATRRLASSSSTTKAPCDPNGSPAR